MADSNGLIGQWVGQIFGTNTGYLMLNVDRDRANYAWVQADDPQQPFSAESLITVTGTTVNGTLSRFSPHGQPLPPGFRLPQAGKFSGTVKGDCLAGTWETDMQTHGQFKLTRREALIARQPDHVMRWRDFRTWALDELQGKSTLIFRGHNSAEHSLVTSFHRTGRRNLLRYDTEDVPRLRRQMEVALNTTFNLLDPLEYV